MKIKRTSNPFMAMKNVQPQLSKDLQFRFVFQKPHSKPHIWNPYSSSYCGIALPNGLPSWLVCFFAEQVGPS